MHFIISIDSLTFVAFIAAVLGYCYRVNCEHRAAQSATRSDYEREKNLSIL